MSKLAKLTPEIEGLEITSIGPKMVIAHTGTGFDPDNPQHSRASCVVRYAIAIQQMRDQKKFDLADDLCELCTPLIENQLLRIAKFPDATGIVCRSEAAQFSIVNGLVSDPVDPFLRYRSQHRFKSGDCETVVRVLA